MSPEAFASVAVLSLMGLGLGAVLAVFSRIFAVSVDPRVERVEKALPGLNCGVCGQASCHAMAEAIVAGKAQPARCAPGGAAVVEKVSAILGVTAAEVEKKVAVVRCQGSRSLAKEKAVYCGIEDCVVVELLGGGAKSCAYGCLGFGTCAKACPFAALRMTPERLPEVIEEKCTACGRCVETCPRGIITLVPRRQKVYLGCVNRDKGKQVKEVCGKGCIGCGLCARPETTPSGKVAMKGNLPVFPADWDDFKDAVEKCPDACFVVRAEGASRAGSRGAAGLKREEAAHAEGS